MTDKDLKYRKLSCVECERLQTFPDNYTATGNYDGEDVSHMACKAR